MPPIYSISTKFEINLQGSQASDMGSAGTYVMQNKIPVMIVNPELFMAATVDRQMKIRGTTPPYLIIVAIDFAGNGRNYAMDKIKQLPKEILEADGYDIMISHGRNEIETRKEMIALNDFFKQLNPLLQIRWVLGCRTQKTESIKTIIKMAKSLPASYIRTDNNVTLPNMDLKNHIVDVKMIRDSMATPIKVSGNVNWETYKTLRKDVARFDVSIAQARNILKDAEAEMIKEKIEKETGVFESVDKPEL